VVSGNTEKRPGRHSKKFQELRKVEKVVEWGHQGTKKDTQARKRKTWMTLSGSNRCESRSAEIHSEI